MIIRRSIVMQTMHRNHHSSWEILLRKWRSPGRHSHNSNWPALSGACSALLLPGFASVGSPPPPSVSVRCYGDAQPPHELQSMTFAPSQVATQNLAWLDVKTHQSHKRHLCVTATITLTGGSRHLGHINANNLLGGENLICFPVGHIYIFVGRGQSLLLNLIMVNNDTLP